MLNPTLCSSGSLAESAGFKNLILKQRKYTFDCMFDKYLSAWHMSEET